MTKKKKKVSPSSSGTRYNSVSFKVEETVVVAQSKSVPVNLAEEKARFFKTGQTPRFEVQDQSKITELAGKTKNQIRFDLQGEAEYILEYVRDKYGDGELFLEHAFGSRITKEEATPMVLEYLNDNSLSESLKIHWCDSLACSAKMVWRGPVMNANKPELRKYSLWINWSDENNYMRESGIKCLMDHEIGTHFFRLINDGFQPWFSDRTRFDLRSIGSFEGQCTEEGLASIHTSLRGRVRLLWSPALAYYTACKAAEMSFKELFDHLGRYTSNIDFRWKQVMRVKRGLLDPGDLGGFGNDQCYFEGAVKILRNMDNIDFYLLMSGKICMDEVDRIKRVVRKDVLRFPIFMKNMVAYRRTLKKMLVLNGLDQVQFPRTAPAIFTKRLLERSIQAGDSPPLKQTSKKVRSKPCMVSLNSKLKDPAAAQKTKKRLDSRKEKDVKKKGKAKITSPEIERFPVSTTFINTHRMKQSALKQREQEDRTNQLEESVRHSIASLDCDLGQHIEHLRNIVREHSWSYRDSEYMDSLISEAYNEEHAFKDGEEEEKEEKPECGDGDHNRECSQLTLSIDFSLDSARTDSPDSKLETCDTLNHNDEQKKEVIIDYSKGEDTLALHPSSGSHSMFASGESEVIKSSDARIKLASKRHIPPDMQKWCPTNSYVKRVDDDAEAKSEPVSVRSKTNTQPHHKSVDKHGKSHSNVQGSLSSMTEGSESSLQDRRCKEDQCSLGLGLEKFGSTEAVASSLRVHVKPSESDAFSGKKISKPSIIHQRMLSRDQFQPAASFRTNSPFGKNWVDTNLSQRNTSLAVLSSASLTDTSLVRFRIPSIKGINSTVRNLSQTDSKKASILLSEAPLVTQSVEGERQLAGTKLSSLAKEQYSDRFNASNHCSDSSLLVSQP